MLTNPPSRPDGNDNDRLRWADLLQVIIATLQARRLARSYVRQGGHPVPSAARAVDSVMMLNATGVVVILWFALAFPLWLIPLTGGFDSVQRFAAWAIAVCADVIIFGIPFLATVTCALTLPQHRTRHQQTLTKPSVVLGSLLAIWPAKIAEIIVLRVALDLLNGATT